MEFLLLLCAIAFVFFAVITINKNEIDFYQKQTGGFNIEAAAQQTGNNLANAGNNLANAANNFFNTGTGIVQSGVNTFGHVATNIGTIGNNAASTVAAAIGNIGNGIGEVGNDIVGTISGAYDTCFMSCTRTGAPKDDCMFLCGNEIAKAVNAGLSNGVQVFNSPKECMSAMRNTGNTDICYLVPIVPLPAIQQTTYTYNPISIDSDCNTTKTWPECLIKDKDGKCSPREQEQRELLENIKNVKCTLQQVTNDIGSAINTTLSDIQSKISGCIGINIDGLKWNC